MGCHMVRFKLNSEDLAVKNINHRQGETVVYCYCQPIVLVFQVVHNHFLVTFELIVYFKRDHSATTLL